MAKLRPMSHKPGISKGNHMIKEEESKKLLSHKWLLLLIKYIPHIIAFAYAIYTFFRNVWNRYKYVRMFLSCFFFTWIILLSLSVVFRYCYVHRLPIYYIGINELITCLDYYLDIDLDIFIFTCVSLLLSVSLIFGYTYYYIKFKLK